MLLRFAVVFAVIWFECMWFSGVCIWCGVLWVCVALCFVCVFGVVVGCGFCLVRVVL